MMPYLLFALYTLAMSFTPKGCINISATRSIDRLQLGTSYSVKGKRKLNFSRKGLMLSLGIYTSWLSLLLIGIGW